MANNTAQLRPASPTKPVLVLGRALSIGDTLDSLKRAFVSAFRLYTSGMKTLVRLGRKAMMAVRRNAWRMFGSREIADSFLMGGY